MAASILSRLGSVAVPLLVQHAIAAGKEAEHRIAILGVIARIGDRLDMDDLVKLRGLIWHPDPAVRDKAEEVIRFM